MSTAVKKPKLISIVGPTGSGKTALSIELAKAFGGEVLSADSRQVYRGMDLGTGKVTAEEMAGIPHHLLDIADPKTDLYTGSDFVRDASVALTNILERNNLPIIVGGTFFYTELLRGTMQPAPVAPNQMLRNELETKTAAELLLMLQSKDPRRAALINPDNKRRLVRALEIVEALGAVPEVTPIESAYEWLTIGIEVPTEILNTRIHERILERLNQGMIEEVADLHTAGVSYERMEDFGLEYRYISRYLRSTLTREAMITELTNKTRQFAKRQRMWLKRDTSIVWFPFPTDYEAVKGTVRDFLTS